MHLIMMISVVISTQFFALAKGFLSTPSKDFVRRMHSNTSSQRVQYVLEWFFLVLLSSPQHLSSLSYSAFHHAGASDVADDTVRSIEISYRGSCILSDQRACSTLTFEVYHLLRLRISVHTYVPTFLVHPAVPRSNQEGNATYPPSINLE
ncbi:hypothetical protein FRC03_005926 [Tulasnella sp. 419]|nr:hypothetical protein FRC02_000178 [Tulasnella sp. 418]KAG8939886.1 hypothetical protein FRC03_005926 [Tulasnella sp. 419]